MQAIVAVLVPYFALVLAGYVAAARRWLPELGASGLQAYVVYFALPALLLRQARGTAVEQLLDPAALLVYAACALAAVFFTIALTLSRRVPMKEAALQALAATRPATGFLGATMLVALLGPSAIGVVIGALLIDLLLTTTLCLSLARAHEMDDDGREVERSEAVLHALRTAITHPWPWAIALGALLGGLDLETAGPVEAALTLLADSAAPVAVFTLGASMWRGLRQVRPRQRRQRAVPAALIKLVLQPLLVLLVGASLRQLGAPLSTAHLAALTLTAALPGSSLVLALAERHEADPGRVGRVLTATVVVAFFSLSLLAFAFGVRPTH